MGNAVLSGLVSAFIIWIVTTVFQKIIIPWYKGIIYNGTDIEDVWKGYYIHTPEDKPNLKTKPSFKLSIKQKAESIEGEMIVMKQPRGDVDEKIFKINGFFIDNRLILNFTNIDKKKFGIGSFVLKLEQDGKELSGQISYVEVGHQEITPIKVIILRS